MMDGIGNMLYLPNERMKLEQQLKEEKIIEVGLDDNSSMVEAENTVNKKMKRKKPNKKRNLREPSASTENKEEIEHRSNDEDFKDDGERFNNVHTPRRSKRTKRQRRSHQSESFNEIFQMGEEVEIVPEVIDLLDDDETPKSNKRRRRRGKKGQQDPVKWVTKRLGVPRYPDIDEEVFVVIFFKFFMILSFFRSMKGYPSFHIWRLSLKIQRIIVIPPLVFIKRLFRIARG